MYPPIHLHQAVHGRLETEPKLLAIPILIFCYAGNQKLYDIAVRHNFKYGAQLPGTVYGPLYFADQNWKKPSREKYMAALAKYRPEIATVIDWEREDQYAEVLSWAEEAIQYVGKVIIIPKVIGGINSIPKQIEGKEIVLGFSVPSKYGGTPCPDWEFWGWPVHLLGGNPTKQILYWKLLSCQCDVVSCDGNYIAMLALRANTVLTTTGYHAKLSEITGLQKEQDVPYKCFELSCGVYKKMWATNNSLC